MEREPLKQVTVGGTGAGKSHGSMKFINEEYSNPRNPHARKTLIYDANFEFKDVKELLPEEIPAFNRQQAIEVRRILPVDFETKKPLGMDDKYEMLCDIIDNYSFKNGLLYLPDLNNYTTHGHTKHLVNLLTTNRHSLCDIYIELQTFGALPPRLWGNINVLRMHKTIDDPFQAKIKSLLGGKVEPLRIAHLIVNEKTRTDEHFCLYVDFRKMKITGEFSMEDYVIACRQYLALNKPKVKEFANIYECSLQDAKNRLIYRLVDDYNGNVKRKK